MPLRTSDQCDITEWAPVTCITVFGMSAVNVQHLFSFMFKLWVISD